MKILKKVLVFAVALIAIVLIVALFVKRDYELEREITISKPKAEVFAYIKELKNQQYYSTFAMKDPDVKNSFKGTDAAVGFIYAWKGNSDVGAGEQEIKKIVEGERVDIELRFKEPMEGKGEAYMTTTSVDSSNTKVKWGFKSKMPYPFNVIRIFVNIENMMGKELNTSLQNMKTNIEKK